MFTPEQIWVEKWMPDGGWQLCVAFSAQEDDINCYTIHLSYAVNLYAKGIPNRGQIWEPAMQGKRP